MGELRALFTDWNERLGEGFAASLRNGGVLRVWILGRIAAGAGLDIGTVAHSLDVWLAHTAPSDPAIHGQLGWRIQRLLEERVMIAANADPYDLAVLDMEIGTMLDDIGQPYDALSREMAAKAALIDAGGWLDIGIVDMEVGMVATDLGWHTEAASFLSEVRETAALLGQLDDFARVLIA